jgi:hypothetical protein
VEKRWRVGGREVVCRWEWVDGLVALVTRSLPLYTFFHFWVEKLMEVGGFFLSSHSTWVVPFFSPFSAFLTFSASLLLKLVSSLSGDSN